MKELDRLHDQACGAGQRTYRDPATGFSVFTAIAHEERGTCCGFGCRHCPYGYSNVPETKIPRTPRDPFLDGAPNQAEPCDVLFWSGGKDSYLALRELQRKGERQVVLLTTFTDATEIVAHQEITLADIRAQALALGLPLLLVPLYPGASMVHRVAVALRTLARQRPIHRLVFGDLHLKSIREWREQELGPMAAERGISLHLPLWQRSYDDLLDDLSAAQVRVTVSAVDRSRVGDSVKVGEIYGPELVARLPEGIDAFGERGEFHTLVEVHAAG